MNTEEKEQLKESLLEMDPCIKFDESIDDKLIGYAERFGCELMPLYEGINTFLFKDSELAIDEASKLSDKVYLFPDLKSSVVGYVVLEQGGVAILHDKEVLLNNLAKEYEESGMEIDEEFESYYSNAVDWYEFNIIGTGLSDMTTPAFACTEEWPLPDLTGN
jgi:hypothetical protein